MRLPRLAACLLVSLAAFAPLPPARGEDPPAPHVLRGGDVKALLEKAAKEKAKDPRALGSALVSLAEASPDKARDVGFLVEYAVRETNRPLRLLAVGSAGRLDAAAAAAGFLQKAQTEKERDRACFALEALALVGNKEHAAPVIELLKHPSEIVAVAAADALARLATSKDVPAIVDASFAHESSDVTDHAAWAVQDLLKKRESAVSVYEKIASKKKDPRQVRAAATLALLQDKQADPHKWTPPFETARKLLFAAPAAIPVQGNPEYVPKVQAALDWMKEKMPAEHWLMCAATKSVLVPGKQDDTRPNAEDDVLEVKLSDAVLPPNKLAYLMFRASTVLWREQIGEPHRGHRGWEPAIFDSFDLCVIAKLYQAGPGGVTREQFVRQIISDHRPWGGL